MKWILYTIIVVLTTVNLLSQNFGIGVGGGGSYGINESVDRPIGPVVRLYALNYLGDSFWGELGVSYLTNSGKNERQYSDYKNTMFTPDIKVRYHLPLFDNFYFYPFVGVGLVIFKVDEVPKNLSPESDSSGIGFTLPAGIGFHYALNKNWSLELQATGNHVFNDNLNPPHDDQNDGYWCAVLSVLYRFDGSDNDTDGDGLTNGVEKEMGTDPNNPDTDGDGLKDGAEVYKHNTNPLNPDTDGDGLKDGAEVDDYSTSPTNPDTDGDGLKDGDEVLTYKTKPTNPDTDGDGLKDGAEVSQHKTNPLIEDTDGDGLTDGDEVIKYATLPLDKDSDKDGLTDGEEVNKYNTKPLMADTDEDGLKDGEEVLTYKTNPLDPDTDKGGMKDGQEVKEKKNPLDPSDDSPKKRLNLDLGEGKQLVLEGIVFETGKAVITPASDSVLTLVLQTMIDFPEIEVEISGHTDNVGKRDKNMKLSLDRAQAVKDWLIARNINGNRMKVVGFGPDKPIVPNDTPENKQKNRRIEFKRLK